MRVIFCSGRRQKLTWQQQQIVSLLLSFFLKINEARVLLPLVSCHRFDCVNMLLITNKVVAGFNGVTCTSSAVGQKFGCVNF